MSQQNLLNQAVAPVATALPAALQPLASLIDSRGEINFDGVDFGTRLQKYIEFEQSCNMNLINFSEIVLSQVPPGTKLVPIPIIPTLEDCWHGKAAEDMKLPEGHVEPTADFIIKIGNIQGCFTQIENQGVNTDSGTEMYEVTYTAGFYLPNGAVISVQGEGKAQELYYTDYKGVKRKQAHIIESTRKKARRNAIKNLNKIPTSMPKEKFLRPWVILRPVFTPGVSPETDRIIERIERSKDQAVAMLYSAKPEPEAIDVVVTHPGELTVDDLKARIKQATTMSQLDAIANTIDGMRLLPAEYRDLRKVWGEHKKLIESGGF